MKYRLFGSTGLRVSQICLGAQRFGGDSGLGLDAVTSRAVFDAYAEAGGNFIDTASVYLRGASERALGHLVAQDRDHFVIATKYMCANPGEDVVKAGASRKNLFRSVEESLRRLRTDHIDILYLHQWDWSTPVQEVLRGMDDLVRTGKIHYPAVSNTPAWIIAQANTQARLSGLSPFAALQAPYSLAERAVERELLPMARAHNMAVCAWAPLAQGAVILGNLSTDGRTTRGSAATGDQRRIAEGVDVIARRIGASAAQVALAWLRQRPDSDVIPVVGADSPTQVIDNIVSVDLTLDVTSLAELEALTAIDLGYPSTYLTSRVVRGLATAFQEERLLP